VFSDQPEQRIEILFRQATEALLTRNDQVGDIVQFLISKFADSGSKVPFIDSKMV
jgi:hypothetical protein